MQVITTPKESKKSAAGVMAIVLGSLGIHKFMLGYNTQGFMLLILSALTLGIVSGIIGIIEGVIYLNHSDLEFYHRYQLGKRPWF